jgi:hypothetical protein
MSPRTDRSVIGKPPGSGGEVSVGTVTSQLLYEIGGTPVPQPGCDRAHRLDLDHPAGTDRVRLSAFAVSRRPTR